MKIKELLRINIDDEVPLVIKAGEQDLAVEEKEISQYIVTHQIEKHLEAFLSNYKLLSTDRIGVWISGFFGSGKSYFAKILGYLLTNHTLPKGITARELFNERLSNCSNPEFIKGNIRALNSIASTVVMFEMTADSSLNMETIQQSIFKKFLETCGYSSFPNVAIMEYELNTFGHLEEVRNYIEQTGNDYSKVAQNVGEFRRHAVKAMTERLDYTADEASEFLKSAVNKYDNLSPSVLAEHCVHYTRETGKRLVFIVDEIGQYVISLKDNEDRILALQGVAEAFASKGKGSVRLIVTSQEKLDQLIANRDFDKRKLGKLTDRFEVRLDLTSENVDEVARERLLKKKIEAEPLFEKTMRENQGNITTLSDTNGNYRKTETKDDLMTYYPFHPYQFQLLPDLVQNTIGSTYYQATARKFIFLVDSILKNLKDEEFGRIVSATDLFDALGPSFFGSGVTHLVNSADQYRGKNVKASDILKTLHIVKNLKNIGASETVITRMLCKNIFDKQYELTKEVKDALDYLEKARYVTRYNGEITLVTDLERDFIAEMENTVIDIPKRNEEIVRQLLNIFNYKEIRYGEGPYIPIEWYLDNAAIGGKKKGLQVRIASFAGVDVEGLEFESMNHRDTVYVIPEINETIGDLAREIKSLDASLNSFRTKKTGEGIHEILTKYGRIMNDKRNELGRELRKAIDSGQLLYEGELKPTSSLINELKDLLKEKVIPGHYTEITFTTATSKDIEGALTRPQNTLKTLKVDDDHRVFNDNGDLIETHKIISPVIASLGEDQTGEILLEKFSLAPYGWTPETIIYSVACLIRGGKIMVNNSDSYGKAEVHKALKSVSEFKKARIRRSVVLNPSDKQYLMDIINPLLDDGRLSLQSPRSEFISRALEAMKHLDKRMNLLKKRMEELGAEVRWNLDTIRTMLNILTGGDNDCLDVFLRERESIRELKETADKTEKFLEKNYELIRKQKVFLQELEGEISKNAFGKEQSEELSSLLKEYKNTLPSIASFGTDLDSIFERLRNTYKSYFNPIHDERDQWLAKINKYLDSIQEEKNALGKRAGDQDWFIRPNPPCGELEIQFSVKCEKCHTGLNEARLYITDFEHRLERLEDSFDSFMREKSPEESNGTGKEPEVQPKRLRLKRKLTYGELKNKLERLSVSEDTELEIELED